MTKKHYEAIAEIIALHNEEHSNEIITALAGHMADYFKQDNPKFNRDMFLTACGITETRTHNSAGMPLKQS